MAPRVQHYSNRNSFQRTSLGLGNVVNAIAALIVVVWALGLRGENGSALGSAFASSPVSAAGLAGSSGILTGQPSSEEAKVQHAVSFVAQASGTVLSDADVFARPGGGAVIGSLRAGLPVEAGGYVRVSGGLLARHVLWVRGESASGVLYGFVAEDAIQVTAGMALEIDVRGVPSEQFLAPAPGAVYSGGEQLLAAPATSRDEGVSVASSGSSPADASVETLSQSGSSGADSASAPVQSASIAGASVAGISVADESTSRLAGFLRGIFRDETDPVASSSEQRDSVANTGVAWMPDSVERWMPQIEAASRVHGVDVKLIAIVTLVESGGNPLAQSPAGAMGLMQIMPATGQDIARIRGIQGFDIEELWNAETNIDFGAWYLAQQLKAFGVDGDLDWQQSVELAASAYNGGPGTVQAMISGGRALPSETERYRAWVGGMWNERGNAQSATFETWWWAGGSRLVESARDQLALR